jgi:hypothetical protein
MDVSACLRDLAPATVDRNIPTAGKAFPEPVR